MLVFDAGGTLTRHRKRVPTASERLQRESPHPQRADDECRALQTTQWLSRADKLAIAARLEISPRILTGYRSPALELVSGASDTLTACAALGARMVALSNMSPLDLDQLYWVRQATRPWLTAVFASCELGVRKPDPAALHALATEYRTETKRMIVIGDRRHIDVAGARNAGARAILVSPSDSPDPEDDPDTVRVVRRLPDIVAILTGWLARPPERAPREHMLRAVVLVEDENGRILVVHAPHDGHRSDRTWHLPGGGVAPREYAAAAAVRELAEEVGLRVEVDAHCARWIEIPARHHVVVVVRARIQPDTGDRLRPCLRELDDAQFVAPAAARRMLLPDDRLVLNTILGTTATTSTSTPTSPVLETPSRAPVE